MKITTAKFVKGITGTSDILYDHKFQIAYVGRSNVGKSTLINSLVSNRNLARTSSNPGRTIRMDFFLINNQFYFVDFPGYGFAKKSADQREKIRKMILWYLMYSNVVNRLLVLIVDSKTGITDFDRDTLDIFYEYKIPHVIIANKADKLKMNERNKLLGQIRSECTESEVIIYSSKENFGKKELLNLFNRFV